MSPPVITKVQVTTASGQHLDYDWATGVQVGRRGSLRIMQGWRQRAFHPAGEWVSYVCYASWPPDPPLSQVGRAVRALADMDGGSLQPPDDLDGGSLASHVPDRPGACPDGGTCGHSCGPGRCWRVRNASPLSAAGWGEDWPVSVRVAESAALLWVRGDTHDSAP